MALGDEYFTISQAAEQVGVTRQTIARWVKEGRLAGERLGRECLIPKELVKRRVCPTCGHITIGIANEAKPGKEQLEVKHD